MLDLWKVGFKPVMIAGFHQMPALAGAGEHVCLGSLGLGGQPDFSARNQPGFVKEFLVSMRVLPAGRRPLVQIAEFDSQYGSLKRIEPAIHPYPVVIVLLLRAVSSKNPERLRKFTIVSRQQSAIPCPAEILRRIKAEARNRTQAPSPFASILGSYRLRRVFYDPDVPLTG
jgi:hypothetical protein